MRSFNPKRTVNGFTLVELVVVIAVLSILSAIGLPTFTCLIKKAKASTAVTQIINISKECITKEAFAEEERFNIATIQGYQIKSDELNNCGDGTGTFFVSAVPDDSINLPTFHYSHESRLIFYAFKNKSGTNLNECLKWICNSNSSSDDLENNFSSSSEANNNSGSGSNNSQDNLSEEEKAAQCTDIDDNGYYNFSNDSGLNTAPSHCGFTTLPGRNGGTAIMVHRFCSAKWPCDQYGQVVIPIDKVSEFLKETDFNNTKKYSAMERKDHPDPEKRLKQGWDP